LCRPWANLSALVISIYLRWIPPAGRLRRHGRHLLVTIGGGGSGREAGTASGSMGGECGDCIRLDEAVGSGCNHRRTAEQCGWCLVAAAAGSCCAAAAATASTLAPAAAIAAPTVAASGCAAAVCAAVRHPCRNKGVEAAPTFRGCS